MSTMLQRVAKLCQTHGFIYPSECRLDTSAYTCYKYGPLGTLFKRNFLQEWWDTMLKSHHDIYAVDNGDVLATTSSVVATDNVITSNTRDFKASGGESSAVHQNPSQGILAHYLSVLSLHRHRLPFGVARHRRLVNHDADTTQQRWIVGSEHVEELSLHYFVPPHLLSQYLVDWQQERLRWWKRFSAAVDGFHLTVEEIEGEGSRTHICYNYPWGAERVETIQDHGQRHLLECQTYTGISHKGRFGHGVEIPHQIECSAIVEKGLGALLLNSYKEKLRTGTKGTQDKHDILKLHPRLAPYKLAIVCEQHSEKLGHIRQHLSTELRHSGITVLDVDSDRASETQFRRYDEMGIPWTVILTDRTLQIGVLLLRHRNSAIQEQVNILKLKGRLQASLEAT